MVVQMSISCVRPTPRHIHFGRTSSIPQCVNYACSFMTSLLFFKRSIRANAAFVDLEVAEDVFDIQSAYTDWLHTTKASVNIRDSLENSALSRTTTMLPVKIIGEDEEFEHGAVDNCKELGFSGEAVASSQTAGVTH